MGQFVEFYGDIQVNKLVDEETCNIIKVLQKGNECEIKKLNLPEMPDGNLNWSFYHWENDGENKGVLGVYGESAYKCYFNNYYPQLKYLIDNILKPKGYELNGIIHAETEDGEESYCVTVEKNEITCAQDDVWRCAVCGNLDLEYKDSEILVGYSEEDFCLCSSTEHDICNCGC